MTGRLSISLDGVTDLPSGTIAAIVTYLEMRERPARRDDPAGTAAFSLARLGADDLPRYLALYRTIGERWLWFSRLVMAPGRLAGILADPLVEAFAVRRDGRDVGLLELDFRSAGEAELAFFGLYDEAIGQGAGRWLMNRALERAWARPIDRFWVHTCTLDHPSAPEFYRRSGFRAYKRAVEVTGDPRLAGHLAAEGAAHHPVIAR